MRSKKTLNQAIVFTTTSLGIVIVIIAFFLALTDKHPKTHQPITRQLPDQTRIKATYTNKDLNFSFLLPQNISGEPKTFNLVNQYGLVWSDDNYPYSPFFSVVVGRYFNPEAQLMNHQEVAMAHLYKFEGESLKPESLTIKGCPATKLVANREYNNSTGILVIQKGELVYNFFTNKEESEALINTIINTLTFLDDDRAPDRFFFNLKQAALKEQTTKTSTNETLRWFFPAGNQPITQTQPTFIGKIRQLSAEFLPSEFTLKTPPYNEILEYRLVFSPGKITNLKILIDDIPQNEIYGFPQYPEVVCTDDHNQKEFAGGIISSNLYGHSQNKEPLASKEECLVRKRNELPPVIFVFKPQSSLTNGHHVLTITTPRKPTVKKQFIVDTSYQLPQQALPPTQAKKNNQPLLGEIDICSPGYHYEANFLHWPLPLFNNPNLLYGLSFPQSEDEKNSVKRRKVYLEFGNRVFDLYLPQHDHFYFKDELNKDLGPYHIPFPYKKALFIPFDNLVYANGLPAKLWDLGCSGPSYESEYLEIFPMDLTGKIYRGNSLPFTMSCSSSCDG
ncbi:MAG: hypothetical protein JW991_05630 [Candidatus Pacebacteria bacterium]|nr:hypothetical protein [Candidatus Paceibacterota bacterium]